MDEINFDIYRVGMKEMFANYGLAMLRASFVEKTLMLLLVAINQISKPEVSPDDIHSVIFADNDKTFGQLLKKLNTLGLKILRLLLSWGLVASASKKTLAP